MTAFERRQSGAPRLMSESDMAYDWSCWSPWKWDLHCMVGAHCVRDRDGRALFTLNSLEAVASEYMGSTRYSRRRHLAACTQGLPLVRLSDRRGRKQVRAWDVRALITLALESDPDLAAAVHQEVDEANCADAVADILEEAVLAPAPDTEDGDTLVEVPEVAVPASAEGGADMVAMEDSDTPEGALAALVGGAPAAPVGGAPAAPVEAAPAAPVEATPAALPEPSRAVTAGPSGNSAAARGADIAGGRRRRKRPRTGSNDGGEGCVPASAQGGTGVATEDGDTPVEGAPAPRPATCARTDPRCPLPHRGPAARAHVRGASA